MRNFVSSVFNNYPKRLILLYHRLKAADDFKSVKDGRYHDLNSSLSVEQFRKQMKWLSGFVEFVSLSEIISKSPPDHWQVAITFDDGYEDNIELGLPIFEQYKIPVTWFISNKFVQSNKLPWWDLLNYIIQNIREEIQITIGTDIISFDLRESFDRQRFKSVFKKQFLRKDKAELSSIIFQLEEICKHYKFLPQNSFADKDLVISAANSPFIEIGGHTIDHIAMSAKEMEIQDRQVCENRNLLQDWTGQTVNWFAYPYGGVEHWDKRSQKVVNNCGFKGAVTTCWGYIGDQVHLFAVPRFTVPLNWGLGKFKASILALNEVQKIISFKNKFYS